MQGIRFEGFSCYYKNKKEYIPALRDIHLEISAGELFVVVGPSGSGKTTLLKCVLGLCEYVEGELYVDGIAIDEFDAKKHNVGYVSQEVMLYPHMTVYDNIAFPLRLIHTDPEEIDACVKNIASRLNISYLLGRLPRQLSGGQQQCVALARAFVKNPQIILLDEPFANIDPVFREQLRLAVKTIQNQYHTTMIFVTHDMQEGIFLADRIGVLEKGRLVAVGGAEMLCREECGTIPEEN